MFQFTHPGKGATRVGDSRQAYLSPFQFTHPGKGATDRPCLSDPPARFQFTHPGKGATWRSRAVDALYVVSIHAPWEGCDS